MCSANLGLYLVATLVNITCCVIIHTKHRNQPIGCAICLKNMNHLNK